MRAAQEQHEGGPVRGRFHAPAIGGCLLLTLAFLAGCGGGGSSGGSGGSGVIPGVSPTPGSTPNAAASMTVDPAATVLSGNCTTSMNVQEAARRPQAISTAPVTYATYSIASNPTGLPVTLNGNADGSTPQSVQPQPNNLSNVVTIGSGTATMTYCVSQAGGPSRTLYYNSVNDTKGSIGSVSSSSIARTGTQSVAKSATAYPRHFLRTASVQRFAADRLLVKYSASKLQTSGRTMLSIEQGAGAASAVTLGPSGGATISRVVRVAAGQTLAALQSSLQADPSVSEVDRVQLRYPLSITPVYPNDPKFIGNDSDQWDLYQIQAPQAWGISEGSSSVSIAVIDTGYDVTAPDLRTKVTYAESVINGTTDTSAGAAKDTDGHGTNVSGIAAADTNNALAVAGVGFNTTLQEYRIFGNTASSGDATTADEAQAIYDAVAHGAKVISMSLGGKQVGDYDTSPSIDPVEYDAVEYAINHGVTVVAAAGNERSTGVTSVDYPAAYPGVIAVGASALNDSANGQTRTAATEYVASYSNSGPQLALVAPGGDPSSQNDADPLHWILNLDTSTPLDASNTCSVPSACLAQFAGTSQATPHVSAAVALLYAMDAGMTPAQARSIVMNTADNINDPRQGAGRLNLYRALASLDPSATVTTPTFQNFKAFAYSNSGGTTPAIIDQTFTSGVPVNTDGTFRLPDLPANPGSYGIAVWDDVNGNGVIDAGDIIGTSGACTGTGPCSATGLTVHPVPSGYTLP